MSDVIKLLPDSVANQIAAGEVIQRPASVIKELVENAVDAGATEIAINLKDAGRTLIQVIDNGSGMSDTDARLAFERHSTSKIRYATDLFALHTMGFRGEALASIAAISQVELRTCRRDDELGTKLEISASKCISQEPTTCAVGCNFMIKNIFFNVPARRKFLKSNQVELSNIIKEFERLALVNYGIEFTVIHNDNTLYKLQSGSFRQRIAAIFGKNIDQQLLPINVETTLVKVHGFICRPENARKRNFLQYFFVNGRHMRHPYFHKAILSGYGQLIANDCQPNYFLDFSVEPDSIDVNIHPTKNEIKFENEAPIWQILIAAVKEALGKFNVVPSIDFDNEGAPVIPVYRNGEHVNAPAIDVDPTYNPFRQSTPGGQQGGSYQPESKTKISRDWERLYENFTKSGKTDTATNNATDCFGNDSDTLQISACGTTVQVSERYEQVYGRYIVTSTSDGLLIIDQHRAHQRILFDNYLSQVSVGSVISQRVLFPEVLHLTPAQDALLTEVEDDMAKIGFILSRLSGNDWAVNGIPQGMEKSHPNELIMQMLDSIENGGIDIKDKVYEHLTREASKLGAIPYGKKLSEDEMKAMVNDLMSRKEPTYTPDGKKTFRLLSREDFSKLFS